MFTDINKLTANLRGVEVAKKKQGIWKPDNNIFALMNELNQKNKDIIVAALATKNIYTYKYLLFRSRGQFLGKFIYNIVEKYTVNRLMKEDLNMLC